MRSLSKDSSATPFSFLKMLWPSFAVSTYEIGVMFVKTATYSVVRSSGTLGGQRICALMWPSHGVLLAFILTMVNEKAQSLCQSFLISSLFKS